MKDIKNKIQLIIEQSNVEKPACKNCKSYCDGGCTFGCVNERNGQSYRFSNKKLTSPEYSCDNFKPIYEFNERTIETLQDFISDIDRVNMGIKNIDLLLNNKIDENDFVDIMK